MPVYAAWKIIPTFVFMKAQLFYFLLLSLLFSDLTPIAAQSALPVNTFVKKESLKHAGISFKAIDLDKGTVLGAHNENMALTPGSTMKLVTSAAALEILGAEHTYNTRLLYDGKIENGILTGNLYIEGVGDPSLGSEFGDIDPQLFLQTYLSAIRSAHIKEIRGDVVALDQLFGYEGVSPKWMLEDLGNAYAPGIYGLSIFDNMFRIELQSFGTGQATKILGINPEIPGIKLTNEIVGSDSSADDSYAAGVPFSYERRLYGTIPKNRSSFMAKSDIPDPGFYAAYYLKEYLAQHGIKVDGEATSYRLSQQLPDKNHKVLCNFTSPPLSSLARVINVRSNNHHTEHLYRLLKDVKGIDIPQYWAGKGLNTNGLFQFDGSGISPANAISAGFLIELLTYMYKKEGTNGAFFQSLPLAGEEGTVRTFLRNTSLAGRTHVKSGSITNVQSYAGYVIKEGKRYAFALIVNNYTGKRADLRKDMEQLLLNVFN